MPLQQAIINSPEVLYNANLGEHLIVDYYDCELTEFCKSQEDLSNITQRLIQILTSYGIKVLGHHQHFFAKDAISLTLNLSESHLNFHTWPEKNYVSFDFFCCTKIPEIKNIMKEIALYCDKEFFHSKKQKKQFISRGTDL